MNEPKAPPLAIVEGEPAGGEPAGSWRGHLLALAVGLAICVAVNFLAVRSYVLFNRYSGFADHFNTVGAIFLLFWVAMAALALRRVHGRLGLSSRQFAVAYAMAMIGAVLPTMGFGGYFLPLVAGVRYYASPENDWANLIWPHLPAWVSPSDPEVIRQLFEGMPRGGRIPWEVWLWPMTCWGLFMVAFFLVSVGLVSLFWTQWVTRERLTFPLAALPTAMTESLAPGRPNIFRSRLLWAGVAVAAAVPLYNFAVGFYDVPAWLRPITLGTSIEIPQLGVGSLLAVDFLAIGIAYLLHVDVLGSIWLFYVLVLVEDGLLGRLGVGASVQAQVHAGGGALLASQQTGALVFMVLYFGWMARGFLRQALADAWHGRWDGSGVMAPRTAAAMVAVGLAGMAVFIHATGMSVGMTIVFLLFTLVVFFGTTRLLAQTGFGRMRAACAPGPLLATGLGAEAFGPAGLTAMGLNFVWSADVQLFVMGTAPHGMKVCRDQQVHRWLLVGAMGLALVAGLVVTCWSYLTLGYQHGLINGFGWYYVNSPQYHWGWVATAIRQAPPASGETVAFFGLGAAVTAAVSVAHHRIPGWPIHPVGLAIAATNTVRIDWVNIFIVWVFKLAVLRYGGPPLYQKLLPLFLGLILGGCLGVGLGALIVSVQPA